MTLEQLADAIRAFILAAHRVQNHEPFDASIHDTFFTLLQHLQEVDDATRSVTFDVPGGDVQTLFCEVRVAAFAIEGDARAVASSGDCPEGVLSDGEFAKHVASLTRALQVIEAWKPFARSLLRREDSGPGMPATTEPAAEPDGPVEEDGFRWQSHTVCGLAELERKLLDAIWKRGGLGGSVLRVDVIKDVWAGADLTNPQHSLTQLYPRLNDKLRSAEPPFPLRVQPTGKGRLSLVVPLQKEHGK